jgi:S1-C subfamily serine protease
LLLCSPAIAFIAVKPVNDTLTAVYRGTAFLHWLTGLATLPPAGSGAATVPAGTAGLNEKQTAVAQEIIQAGIDRGLEQEDIKLALMTAMQESTMQELEHGDDWHFQAMGWGKSDSVGPFQQRDSWGSRECRIDAKCSANLFYDALLQVSDRHSMPEWKAISTVQRPDARYEQHYQQWDEKADEILKAVKTEPSSATAAVSSGKTVPFKGIQVTSARDSSGEPGLDYVVSNGDRGAEFGALAAGTVVEVVADQHWESHLEAGGQERGYGNLVVVRVNEAGEEIDMLYAHLDRIDVKEGDRVSVGTVLGTQGRTGSTTGAHVSVDFFAPGTRTANDASLAMRDRIAGILQSNPESLNQQVQTAQTPAPDAPGKPQWDFSDIRLPFFQQPAAAPQAAANGIPASFISVRSPNDLPCSGFAVAPDRVVTAAHCISDPRNTIVVSQSGDWLKGQVVASAEDAAIVSVPGATFTPAQLGDAPAPGDVLTSWGHPHGNTAIESAQIKITAINSNTFMAAQAGDRRVVDGFSGGPVFDAAGRAIGFNSEANLTTGAVKVQAIGLVKQLLN